MTIDQHIQRAKKALAQIAPYDGLQIEEAIKACGDVLYQSAESLASVSAEETGADNVDEKIREIRAAASVMRDWPELVFSSRQRRRPGAADAGTITAAVISAAAPVTEILYAFAPVLWQRGALILCPDPRAVNTCGDTVDLLREVLAKHHLPEDLLQPLESPCLERAIDLLSACDHVVTIPASFGGRA